MNWLLQDIRYALRQLRKSPGFAAVAVITLALGIGANTAIFSVVNGVLLRPLPFKDPGRLVRIWHVPPPKSFPGMTLFAVSAANYRDWENQNHVFDSMAIMAYHGFTMTGGDKPEQVAACAVSSDFFSTLGVPPMLGRVFSPDEDQVGRSHVVVLSRRMWQENFGSNPDIVGHNINLDGEAYLVAGVMPASFRFPDFAQMWTPMAWTDKERAVRGEHHYMVIARLKPGVELQQAKAEMNTISDRLQQLYPDDDKGWGATVLPLHDDMVSDVRTPLLVLLGAVAFVLLIACVNVANLALAKTFSRQKEIAIRTALGASWPRVLRQLLTETVLLALAGGALGLSCAHFGIRLIVAFLGDKLPTFDRDHAGFAGPCFHSRHFRSQRNYCGSAAGRAPGAGQCKPGAQTGAGSHRCGFRRTSHPQHSGCVRGRPLPHAVSWRGVDDPQLSKTPERESRF